jgi:uncharacterized delta-60 repeat protein
VLTPVGYSHDVLRDVAVDAQGRIVAAGDAITATGYAFAVARYLPDGQRDPGFGTNGLVTTQVGATSGGVAVAVLSDGRIVVGGYSDGRFVVIRYDEEGTLDASFGGAGTGIVITTLADSALAHDMALQPDGKILLAGQVHRAATNADLCVIRYFSNGARDLAFGANGIFAPTVNGSQRAFGMALDRYGRIVLAGDTESVGPRAFYVARLDSTGAQDWDFGSFGNVLTPFGAGGAGARGVAIQSDGRIVVAGDTRSASGAPTDTALARYHESGSLDSTFDGDGKLIVALAAGYDYAADVQVQSNGKILIVGGADSDAAFTRLDASGAPDIGLVLTPLGPDGGSFASLALQPDGKVVAAGTAFINGYDFDFAVARYHGDFVDVIFADGFEGL